MPQQVLCKMMGVKMWFWTITIIHSHTKSKFEATLGRFFPCLPAVMLTSLWGRVVSLPMITIPCPTLRPGHQICSLFPLLFGRLPAASGSHDAFPDAFFNHSGSMIWIQQPINKVLFGHDKHCILTYILKKNILVIYISRCCPSCLFQNTAGSNTVDATFSHRSAAAAGLSAQNSTLENTSWTKEPSYKNKSPALVASAMQR